MTPSQPISSARRARESTRSATLHEKPRSARSPWSRLVSTVTARIFTSPRASTAARMIASLPWTVVKLTPRPWRRRTAERTVSGTSKNFRSAKTFLPCPVSQATSSQ